MELLSTLSKGLDVADMAWEVKCREEDMQQRALENERRQVDDARRAVNEKAEQLKAISGLSALVAGFAMVVQTNVPIPKSLDPVLLCLMGSTTAAVVASMLIAMLNSTFILVAIFKYDCHVRDISFDKFWRQRCEADWQLSYNAFTLGIPLFLVMLAQVGWVVFWKHPSRDIASIFVSAIAFLTLSFWVLHTKYKWGGVLAKGHVKLTFRK
mmetsp:Transcript_23180/g.33998  ORF Transcript_23180/g.33998 Transcript_23180/m.33998 type:complete len:211 (-) Transcript_23180:271-903(-)